MSKKKIFLAIGLIVCVIVAIVVGLFSVMKTSDVISLDSETMRAKSYKEITDADADVDNCEYVKFSAFFTRDLDGDGYAESIGGTCREIGKQDILYMELNVLTEGYLKDAKITIDGKNFYLETALPKDQELKENYVGYNIKEIKFNDLASGTQKLLTGFVRSRVYWDRTGLENSINNYSREDNKIILTGTYVDESGKMTRIRKEVSLTVDWYGTTVAEIDTKTKTQKEDIKNAINEEEGTVNVEFEVKTKEDTNKLLLKRNHLEADIPELNGYAPIEVVYTGNLKVTSNYDEETKKFTIDRETTVGEDGKLLDTVQKENNYSIKIIYPIEAYRTLGADTIEIRVPVTTYYEGYNNPNDEFENPYRSNIAKSTIVKYYKNPEGNGAIFHTYVGKYVYTDYSYKYIVSKQKPLRIYNGISEEEIDDTYQVMWSAYTGTDGQSSGICMKETKNEEEQVTDQFIKKDSSSESMENVSRNIGIYFSGATGMLGDNGWIKVYDDETGELLETFTKDNWDKYTSNNPYKYDTPVKHIRVETSDTNVDSSFGVYNIKELDDEYITNNYEKEHFDELQYIKSTVTGYIGGRYVNTDTHSAIYEFPYSKASIIAWTNTISTQSTENVEIEIRAEYEENRSKWKNGIFLVKLPEAIVDVQLNNITISNKSVSIESYEVIEDDTNKFIKIVTKNENPEIYHITLDVDLSPDPRTPTIIGQIELYATNEIMSEYSSARKDIYDVNNNLNTDEMVNYYRVSLEMVAPNSLLTSQTATNYDDKDSIVVSPQIAAIKPQYAVVDQEQQTATIGVQIRNNYANTISDIKILGKIPFEGNTYVISGADLNSSFTTKMTDQGIAVPKELQRIAKVYYSENENPDNDLTKEDNNWKTVDQVENWDNVKTFLIDLEKYIMQNGEEFTFNYTVKIPNGLEFHQTAYSHHGVWFSLDTAQGKYKTKTEPNKLGFRIAEKYDLELQKYQTEKDKLVLGATYSIKEIVQDENGNEAEEKTGLTTGNGTLRITNLYAEKIYEIKEIKSPDEYEVNSDVIRFIVHVNKTTGELTLEKISGTTRDEMTITKNEGENHKVIVKVEDEAKANIKITKLEQGTEKRLAKVKYRLTGKEGKIITTDENGEILVKGLSINEEYTIKEVKADGYYLASQIKFKIVNNEGKYSLEIIEGNFKENTITEENSIPTLNVTLEDEKIPTYDLEVIKIKKQAEVNTDKIEENESTVYLTGAKFKLYKGTKEIGEYITDENGRITIPGLYQYETEKNVIQTYTLKEVVAPDGYTKAKNITFKVEKVDGELQFIEKVQTGQTAKRYTVEGTTVKVIVEDNPSFRLIKKDEETGELLPNVKFAIYNVDDEDEVPARNSKGEILGTKEIINGDVYYTITTNENGEITADLQEGLYKAVEVEAPEKYDITNSTYYFGIGTSVIGKIEPQVVWARGIGGNGTECMNTHDSITSVAGTSDGGYIVVGDFASKSIDLGNGIKLNNFDQFEYIECEDPTSDVMIIKYSEDGEVEWTKVIGGNGNDYINSVVETSDGGYLLGGSFSSKSIDLGNVVLDKSYKDYDEGWGIPGYWHSDAMIIKCSANGEVEWAKAIGGERSDRINSVAETSDGGYVIGGSFNSNSIVLESEIVLNNNVINTGRYSSSSSDGMIIKLDSKGEVEWGNVIGDDKDDSITSVVETSDGDIIVGGRFISAGINLGSTTDGLFSAWLQGNSNITNGMIVRYDSAGNLKCWLDKTESNFVRGVTCWSKAYVASVVATKDGGYVVGVNFSDDEYNSGYLWKGQPNYVEIIKFNRDDKYEWYCNIKGSNDNSISSLVETGEGGYIVGETSSGNIDLENGVTLTKGRNIIKLDSKGGAEWAKEIGCYISSVATTSDGSFIIGGSFNSESVDLGNGVVVNNSNNYNYNGYTGYNSTGIVMKLEKDVIAEIQELAVENKRKEFKITTDVAEIDERKGGSISGEDEKPYEVVKYGDSNIQEIVMVPDENYEIISITINGEDYPFEVNEDGTYTMPTLENITENKHIVVTYSYKNNKIIINKIDSITKERLVGAKFKLDQIEKRTDPEDIFGKLTENGKDYCISYNKNEVSGVKGALNNNGEYYFIEQDGKYVPTNSKTYQTANGGTAGKGNTTANSYIPIDLTDKEGNFVVVVNAEVSSESYYDYGYAIITETQDVPSYYSTVGRFIYESGTVTAKDYTSEVLEGGKIYYLHFGYRKSSSGDTGNDQIIIDSVNVYDAITEKYNFVENAGKYESTNQGKDNTTANSYVPIDLRGYTGRYNLIVNAEVSSESSDYGYATITEDTNRPSYNTYTGRFIYISGTQTAKDYETVLDGGKLYYLHLGYYKNTSISEGKDTFTINSINVTPNDSNLYSVEVETNSDGQAITQIPFGKYEVTEIEAPDEYFPLEKPIVIDFTADGVHEFNIENERKPKVEVHHYIKETTTKLADDELLEGKMNEIYLTAPRMDFEKYELEKDEVGEYIIPDNAVGIFMEEDQEVTYYYEEREIPLTVHHYIEGTTIPVELKDGTDAEDENKSGKTGDIYETSAISEELLNEKYELVEVPENAKGTYGEDEIIVTYYYRLKEYNITTRIESITINRFNENTNEYEDITVKGGNVSGENEAPYETVSHGYDSIKEIKAIPDSGYAVSKIIVNGEEIEFTPDEDGTVILDKFVNVTEDKEIVVEFVPIEGNVIVHHYIEGTTEKVPLKDGTAAEDETKNGSVSNIYITKANENVSDKYELVKIPENSSGKYIDGTIIVTYYYKLKEHTITTKVNPITISVLNENTNEVEEVTVNGGTILGENQTPYEEVIHGNDSKKAIIATPDEGYRVKSITVNGESIEFTANEDGTVTLSNFVNVTEDKEIVVEFEAITGTVIVHHYIEGTTTGVPLSDGTAAEDEEKTGRVGNPYATKAKDDISAGYELVSTSSNSSGIYTEDTIEVTYYYGLKEFDYIVEYYYDGVLDSDKTEIYTATYLDEITEYTDKVIAKYKLEKTENLPLTISADETENVIKVYYVIDDSQTKELSYTVEYYYDGKIDESKTETISATYQDVISTYTDKNITGYKFDKTENLPLTVSENSEENIIKVYYVRKDAQVVVKYLEKDDTPEDNTDNKVLADEVIIEGYIGKEYTTSKKDIANYTFVESTDNTSGTMTEETITVVYYYLQNTKVIVNHIDKNTGEILETIEEKGIIGDVYTSTSKEFEDYVLVEGPEEETVTMTKEVITLNYYYVKVSAGVIEKHVNIITGEILYNELHKGNEGDAYSISSKEFENYEIVTNKMYYSIKENLLEFENKGLNPEDEYVPENYEGIMTTDVIEVVYYYIRPASVKVIYVDVITGEEIDSPDYEYGYEGDEYTTQEKDIKDYVLVEDKYPENAEGTMEVTVDEDGTINTETIVIYYYVNKAKVVERHIDIKTGKLIEKETIYTGNEGDSYSTSSKEFEGYDLVEEKLPENAEGTMTKDPIEVKYYYIRKASVVVEYIDIATGKKLTENVRISGHEGDSYKTEEKNFKDYELVQLPENATGTMEVKEDGEGNIITEIVVRYYYEQKAKQVSKVVEKHIDVDTNKLLEIETVYTGVEGDSYKTSSKTFDGYELVKDKLPQNAEGKMTAGTIEVVYYYSKKQSDVETPKSKVTITVEHLEVGTGKKLAEDDVIVGEEGQNYTTNSKNIVGFTLRKDKLPENKDGIMKENIVVKYYYESSNVKQSAEPTTPTTSSGNKTVETTTNSSSNTTTKTYTPSTGDELPFATITTIIFVIALNVIVTVTTKQPRKELHIEAKRKKGRRLKTK